MTKVAAAVIEKEGKVLIAKRGKGDRLGGKWEFPGGKIEAGETPQECLKRELAEELGIEAEIGDFICLSSYSYSHIEVELLAYRASHLSGDIRLYVHDQFRWVSLADLPAYDFPEANRPVIGKLLAGTVRKEP